MCSYHSKCQGYGSEQTIRKVCPHDTDLLVGKDRQQTTKLHQIDSISGVVPTIETNKAKQEYRDRLQFTTECLGKE